MEGLLVLTTPFSVYASGKCNLTMDDQTAHVCLRTTMLMHLFPTNTNSFAASVGVGKCNFLGVLHLSTITKTDVINVKWCIWKHGHFDCGIIWMTTHAMLIIFLAYAKVCQQKQPFLLNLHLGLKCDLCPDTLSISPKMHVNANRKCTQIWCFISVSGLALIELCFNYSGVNTVHTSATY